MIATLVGAQGHVVSLDIDPEVAERATRLLDKNGYASRVRVLVADAAKEVPGKGPFDAIIVTAGAWDIPPAWLRQLAPGGTLVVPLVMNGVTRTIEFHTVDDHLVGASTEVAGFVPMQGIGRRDEQVFTLTSPIRGNVTVRFDIGAPHDPARLQGILSTDPVEAWSG